MWYANVLVSVCVWVFVCAYSFSHSLKLIHARFIVQMSHSRAFSIKRVKLKTLNAWICCVQYIYIHSIYRISKIKHDHQTTGTVEKNYIQKSKITTTKKTTKRKYTHKHTSNIFIGFLKSGRNYMPNLMLVNCFCFMFYFFVLFFLV